MHVKCLQYMYVNRVNALVPKKLFIQFLSLRVLSLDNLSPYNIYVNMYNIHISWNIQFSYCSYVTDCKYYILDKKKKTVWSANTEQQRLSWDGSNNISSAIRFINHQ